MIELIKKIVPKSVKDRIKAEKAKATQKRVAQLPLINELKFKKILTEDLGISKGDIVFIHSSIDKLNLDFPFYTVLNLLLEAVGENGTIAFPTYPPINSYEYLKQGNVFNIRRTPSYTGILSEFARRHTQAIRSLHPSKSVAAIGPMATELTKDHHLSPYPYDFNSPYYKLVTHKAKVIGLGVKSTYLSMVHSVDDTLREIYPVKPYHTELFKAKCIGYDKQEVTVETYAHDMKKMHFDLPSIFAKHLDSKIVQDIEIDGMYFFRADAEGLYNRLKELLNDGITIYSDKFYEKK